VCTSNVVTSCKSAAFCSRCSLTHWRHAEATDTGLVRQSNQDAVYVDDSLAIVADGMVDTPPAKSPRR